jgi:hypothetical protein
MRVNVLFQRSLVLPVALTVLGFAALRSNAQTAIYTPIELPASREITDILTEQDIPTGFGGFARDYTVYLEEKILSFVTPACYLSEALDSVPQAGIAQLVEQRTENPRVGGSSPPPGIQVNQAKSPEAKGFGAFLFWALTGGGRFIGGF